MCRTLVRRVNGNQTRNDMAVGKSWVPYQLSGSKIPAKWAMNFVCRIFNDDTLKKRFQNIKGEICQRKWSLVVT